METTTGGGNVTISNCYILGSDTYELIKLNGGGGSTAHLIRNNLIKLGRTGVATDAYVKGLTIEKNIISGWPYWGHLAHEVRDGSHGGGSRYQSNCRLGILIWSNTTSPNPIFTITNNLIISTYNGIYMGNTRGVIRNNTIVNPFALQAGWENNGANIQSHTMGIGLVNGFGSGGVAETAAIENNAIIVTGDNRAAKATGGDGYTTGISGYGIAFAAVEYYGLIGYSHYVSSGSLMGTYSIQNNNVWGFFSKDGDASLGSGGTGSATNWGEGLTTCGSNGTANCVGNFSSDPKFAYYNSTTNTWNDPTPENDGHIDTAKHYELYEDNFFEASTAGSCHADMRSNTEGSTGFVDLTSSNDIAALGDCAYALDTSDSPNLDSGTGSVDNEPSASGGLKNVGAFGGLNRASKTTPLRITGMDVGNGGVRNNNANYNGTGIIQAHMAGLKEVNIYFNRAVSVNAAYGVAFGLKNYCGTDLTAPAGWNVDTSGASSSPYKVKLSWTTGYTDQGIRVVAKSTGISDQNLDPQNLDGEITNAIDGPLPSGNGSPGGDAEFMVYSLRTDVNGNRTWDSADVDAIVYCISNPGNCVAHGPFDQDDSGTFTMADYGCFGNGTCSTANYWVTTATDRNNGSCVSGDCSLREAINAANVITGYDEGGWPIMGGKTIRFDPITLDSCNGGTTINITEALGLLPAIAGDHNTIDASVPAVTVTINDARLDSSKQDGDYGLRIFGEWVDEGVPNCTSYNNTITGLRITNFSHSGSYLDMYGILVESLYGGNTISSCVLSSNGVGVQIEIGTGNTVKGCLIGTNSAGTSAMPNQRAGVVIQGADSRGAISNTIGGTSSSARNIISGNTGYGVIIEDPLGTGNVYSNLIMANYIGTDINGTSPLANGSGGIIITTGAYGTTIGGTSSGKRNIISGNTGYGIVIGDVDEYEGSNSVYGNYIGTNAAGTGAIANTSGGIYIHSIASNTIGGNTSGKRNVISGNTNYGIQLDGVTSNTVYGNYIGVASDGTSALGNSQYGISLSGGAHLNIIGTTSTGYGNIIANNTTAGIYATGATTHYNKWQGNIIYGNTTPIILASGAQDGVATPSLTCADTNTVKGTGAAGNAVIHIYTNDDGDNDCEAYVTSVTANGSGNFTKDSISSGLTVGQYVTVIQTDMNWYDSSATATRVLIGAGGTCSP